MDNYQELIAIIAMTMGVGWASGINLYAALLVLGIGGTTGNIALPEQLSVLQQPVVIAAAGFMYCLEFVADKTPGVDTGWDAIHSFIRIPAGAVLAAGAVGEVSPALAIAAGILGGGIAGVTHFTKASTRVLINTSPEPVSNWAASLGEDLAVLAGMWAMFNYPLLFLGLLLLFLALTIWLLPKLWRAANTVFAKLRSLFGSKRASAYLSPASPEGPPIPPQGPEERR